MNSIKFRILNNNIELVSRYNRYKTDRNLNPNLTKCIYVYIIKYNFKGLFLVKSHSRAYKYNVNVMA